MDTKNLLLENFEIKLVRNKDKYKEDLVITILKMR